MGNMPSAGYGYASLRPETSFCSHCQAAKSCREPMFRDESRLEAELNSPVKVLPVVTVVLTQQCPHSQHL